jgi:hypothetical protein
LLGRLLTFLIAARRSGSKATLCKTRYSTRVHGRPSTELIGASNIAPEKQAGRRRCRVEVLEATAEGDTARIPWSAGTVLVFVQGQREKADTSHSYVGMASLSKGWIAMRGRNSEIIVLGRENGALSGRWWQVVYCFYLDLDQEDG